MPVPGGLLTTAMAVMPHKDAKRALDLACSLDIPFWPQLPLLSYYEDMYVQASENFPGIVVDASKRKIRFSKKRFMEEVEELIEHWEDPAYFQVSEVYSSVYRAFLALDLSDREAIRGQMEGPVSLGYNVLDDEGRPILFDDEVRALLLEFTAKRVNAQLMQLKEKNPNAFMYVDEPGLQFIFSALSGYTDTAARGDLEGFFSSIERPRGIHLCGNPDWDFLLGLDLDILSLDVYRNGEVFVSYAPAIKAFLDRGGVIVWGLIPTQTELFYEEDIERLQHLLEGLWERLTQRGMDIELILSRSLLSVATCCLVNPDGERTVEEAFRGLRELSTRMREKFQMAC